MDDDITEKDVAASDKQKCVLWLGVYLVTNNRKTVIGSAGFSHFWQLLSVSHKIKPNLLAKGTPVPDATITGAVFSNTFFI